MKRTLLIAAATFLVSCENETTETVPSPKNPSYETGTVQNNEPVGYWLEVKVGYPFPDGSVKTHEFSLDESRVYQYHTDGTIMIYSLLNDTLDLDTTQAIFYSDQNYYSWFNSIDQSRIEYNTVGDTLTLAYKEIYINYLVPYGGSVPPTAWGL